MKEACSRNSGSVVNKTNSGVQREFNSSILELPISRFLIEKYHQVVYIQYVSGMSDLSTILGHNKTLVNSKH